jgi:O-methyltransferase involved in polyketide biosynthesis
VSVRVALDGVPETLLWTLYHRASEARRGDAVLHDPMGVELLERIDFPFAERFGRASDVLAQAQALRALRFDQAIRRFAAAHPGGTAAAGRSGACWRRCWRTRR